MKSALASSSREPGPPYIDLLGIRLDNLTISEALGAIMAQPCEGWPRQICFVNAHCVNVACADPEYFHLLRRSSLNLADGIGLRIGARILGRKIIDNVNGTDLFPRLCEALENSGDRLYLLGGRPGIVERVVRWIEQNHPRLRVAGCHHGYFDAADHAEVTAAIARSGATVLLVAMGVPVQEKWIDRHLLACNVNIAIGVGGLFDFYSGRIPRAPRWIRKLGAEWLYRLYQEPQRMWRRYLIGNIVFLARLVVSRIAGHLRPRDMERSL